MAKLIAYTVTSSMGREDIKNAVLANLKKVEKTANDDAFSLTFDNNTKKLYMIFSEQMVSKNANMSEHLVEIKPDIDADALRGLLDGVYASKEEIERLRQAISDSVGDGGVLDGSHGSDGGGVIGGSPAAEKTYDKFVVVGVYGQSNSVGYDESALTLFDKPINEKRVMQFSDSVKPLSYCAENVQNMANVPVSGNEINARYQNDAFQESDRANRAKTKGIHLPLANLICGAIPDDYGVLMVPCSCGGMGIDKFVKNGQKASATGVGSYDTNLYTEFVKRLKGAMNANNENIFAGIVWCQGENNCGNAGTQYVSQFRQMVTDINNELSEFAKRSTHGSITEKDWYFFEWPAHYKRLDSGGILTEMKKYLESRYVPIPDETPFNLTKMTTQINAAHFGQNTYRTVIAPRVFNAMQANGAFLCNAHDNDTIATQADTSPLDNKIRSLETQLQQLIAQIREGGNINIEDLPKSLEWRAITTGEWTRGFGTGSNPENDVYACTGSGGCSGYYVPAEAKGVKFKIRSGDAVKSNLIWLLCSYNGELNQPAGLTMDFESGGTVVNWIKSANNFNQYWQSNGKSAQTMYALFNKHDEEIIATFESDGSIKIVSGSNTETFTPIAGQTLRFGFGELGNQFSDNNTAMYDVQILI